MKKVIEKTMKVTVPRMIENSIKRGDDPFRLKKKFQLNFT